MSRRVTPRTFTFLFFAIAALMVFATNRGTIGGDGGDRWQILAALMEEGRLSRDRFTLVQPLLASPLYAMGALTFAGDRSLAPGSAAYRQKRLKHIQNYVKKYNKVVALLVLLWVFLALIRLYGFGLREAAWGGVFLLSGSMLLPQAMDFYSECTWTLTSLLPLAYLSARVDGEEPFMGPGGVAGFILPVALSIPLNPLLAPVFTAAALGAAALIGTGGGSGRARKAFSALAWSAAAIALGLLACFAENWLRRGGPLRFGYSPGGAARFELFSAPMYQGVAGQLFSPTRGIVFFAPSFFLGFLLVLRRDALAGPGRRFVQLALLYSAVLLLAYSKWFAWHGAGGWGPRYLLPLSVFGAVFFAVSVQRLWREASPGLRAALAAIGAVSILVYLLGETINDTYLKQCYARLTDHEACYWEWRSFPFASLLRRRDWADILTHRGLIASAVSLLLFGGLLSRVRPAGDRRGAKP